MGLLDEKHKPFIRLILRSPDVGEGWRRVSQTLRPTITKGIAEFPELYETREMAGLQVRLSDRPADQLSREGLFFGPV